VHRPDVALTDIHLAGGSSGIVAACKMHDLYGIRCIFLSGNLDEPARTAVQSCNPVDFLGKPVMAVVLQRALRKAEAATSL